MTELGDVVVTLNPAMNKGVQGGLSSMMPQADQSLYAAYEASAADLDDGPVAQRS